MNTVWCPDCFAVLASESGVEHWVIEEHMRRGCPAGHAQRTIPGGEAAGSAEPGELAAT